MHCRIFDLQTHQLDEQDALAEEEEAIRLQKKQAAALDEDDFLIGAGVAPKTKQLAAATPGKAGGAAAGVERIARNTEALSKAEKLQLVATGGPTCLPFASCEFTLSSLSPIGLVHEVARPCRAVP